MSPIIIAFLFNVLDIISGLFKAWKNREIRSGKLREGIFKKCGFILLYLLAFLIDKYGNMIGFTFNISILAYVVLMVVATEIISILENLDDLTGEDNIITSVLNKLHLGDKKE